MSRRRSVGFALSPGNSPSFTGIKTGRLSMGGRRSIGAMGPPATPCQVDPQDATTSSFLVVPEVNI